MKNASTEVSLVLRFARTVFIDSIELVYQVCRLLLARALIRFVHYEAKTLLDETQQSLYALSLR